MAKFAKNFDIDKGFTAIQMAEAFFDHQLKRTYLIFTPGFSYICRHNPLKPLTIMKKSIFNRIFTAMTLACFIFLSTGCSSDDNPAPQPAPGSPTFYYVEAYAPSCFNWMDISSTLGVSSSEVKSGTAVGITVQTFVGVQMDPKNFTSFSDIPYASLRESMKHDLSSELQSSYRYMAYAHKCTTLPDTFQIAHLYRQKEDYTGAGSKDFCIWMGGIVMDDQGQSSSFRCIQQRILGVQEGKEETLLKRVSDEYSVKFIIDKDESGRYAVTLKPYYSQD